MNRYKSERFSQRSTGFLSVSLVAADAQSRVVPQQEHRGDWSRGEGPARLVGLSVHSAPLETRGGQQRVPAGCGTRTPTRGAHAPRAGA